MIKEYNLEIKNGRDSLNLLKNFYYKYSILENIDEILSILRVSSEVKANVQNAINAGMEAIVPEEEITYFGWRGCGYILYNPETGAGACLITGGAAGAEIMIGWGLWILAYNSFVDAEALIIEGYLGSPYPLETDLQTCLAIGASHLLGYLPVYRRPFHVQPFLEEISKPQYKYYTL
jgi:hypothetical protein